MKAIIITNPVKRKFNTKWNVVVVSTFGLFRKIPVLVNVTSRYDHKFKKSELLYKKLELIPWIQRKYDQFVRGKGRRRGARFNRRGGMQRGLSLRYNSPCDPYFLLKILYNVRVCFIDFKPRGLPPLGGSGRGLRR